MVPLLPLQAVALWLLLALPLPGAPQRASAQTQTRSPHGNLSIPCQNCHTFSGWKPLRSQLEFDHNKTRYPLRGMHASVACGQCHTNLVFSNVGSKCADCHADIHRGQMGANCAQCHTVKGWMVTPQAIKQHENRFPLLGAHAALECEDCHKGAATGQFQGLPTDCASCHLATFQRTTSPSHVALRFPTDCQLCHTSSMDSWLGAKFDHARFTGFALTGMHAQLDCAACHPGGRYQGTPADCIGCHSKDYNNAKSPNHVQFGFPQSCAMCHNTTDWMQASFDHLAITGYALTGAHATLACTQCHLNGNYSNTSTACSSCHMKDFNSTTDPNHVQAGFPTDCSMCHSTASWAGATFDHSKTGFPLTGAHATLACATCHVNGNYNLTSGACSSCHMKDYNSTTDPNHAAAGFPTDCSICHSTVSWAGATFDHSKTAFPLTGAHLTVPCTSCHVNNVYAGTPTDCYSCHKADYLGTSNPNHTAAGFPTTCALCHTTTAWTGATFNHTWFPIYSGTHAGKWTTCADCHTNASNFAVFSCITCHTHDKTTTDGQHTGVPNYVYNGTSCYTCHPTGTTN